MILQGTSVILALFDGALIRPVAAKLDSQLRSQNAIFYQWNRTDHRIVRWPDNKPEPLTNWTLDRFFFTDFEVIPRLYNFPAALALMSQGKVMVRLTTDVAYQWVITDNPEFSYFQIAMGRQENGEYAWEPLSGLWGFDRMDMEAEDWYCPDENSGEYFIARLGQLIESLRAGIRNGLVHLEQFASLDEQVTSLVYYALESLETSISRG